MITDSDKRSILYFIREKRDITRWCDWRNKKDEIEREYPKLIKALKKIKKAEKKIDKVLSEIGETLYD